MSYVDLIQFIFVVQCIILYLKHGSLNMENNKFIMFPSTQEYFITSNQSKKMNIFLIVTYEYV